MAKRIEDLGVDRKMLERLTWKSTFANYISKLVGYPITEENVHSDENGWDYFVTSKSLMPNHPLLLVHHTGPLMAIIPYHDYMELENGEVYPLPYIANAHWNYGKYAGGKDIRSGVFWMPLEKMRGISNTEKISQYLNQIGRISIHPEDDRQRLFIAVENRIRQELELNVHAFMSYNGENAFLLAHPTERDTVTCYLPAILLNDILYHPGERDWQEFAKSFRFELGVENSKKRYIIPVDFTGNRAEFCRSIWRKLGYASRWYATAPVRIKDKTTKHYHQKYNQSHRYPYLHLRNTHNQYQQPKPQPQPKPQQQHQEHDDNGFAIFGFMKKIFGKN